MASWVKRNVILIPLMGFFLIPTEALFCQHWKVPQKIYTYEVLESNHFRIHYPRGLEHVALQASVYAEETAAYLTEALRHRPEQKIPVFLFASQQDFAVNNILPFELGEGTGGFTDFLHSRVSVPYNGDLLQFRHVLAHEIVHAFQYDVIRGESPRGYPLWLIEGMAEYLSVGWDHGADAYIREAVVYGRMPSLRMMDAGYIEPFMNYKGGQALLRFVHERFGHKKIGMMLKEFYRRHSTTAMIRGVFGMEFDEFDLEFEGYLRAKYAPFMQEFDKKRETEKSNARRTTNRYEDGVGYNIAPAVSPDGKRIAYLTGRKLYPAIVIRTLPGPGTSRDEVEDETIVLEALRSRKYEEYHPLSTRLNWSEDGAYLIVSGRYAGRQALLVVDVEEGEVIDAVFPPVEMIQFPFYHGKTGRVFFTGLLRGKSDIFSVSLGQHIHGVGGEKDDKGKDQSFQRHTGSMEYERDVSVSDDGRWLYYSAPVNANNNTDVAQEIYRLDLVQPRSSPFQVTNGGANTRRPMPEKDGSILVISDITGVPNIYRIRGAATRRVSASVGEFLPVTGSLTGIGHAHLQTKDKREILSYTEFVEGASELYVMDSGESGKELETDRALGKKIANAYDRPGDPSSNLYRRMIFGGMPHAGEKLNPEYLELSHSEYDSYLSPDSPPFIMITGGQSNNSQWSVAAMAFGSFSDLSGNHNLMGFVTYLHTDSSSNMDLRYEYKKYRTDFFVGGYKKSGAYAIFDYYNFQVNDILYNPYYRVLDRNASGVYGGAIYPLHRYSAVSTVFHHGRNETKFRRTYPDERTQNDIYDNFQALSMNYSYDNSVYSIYGALDGQALSLSYTVPMKMTGSERELYTFAGEYRGYYMFSDYSGFAFRMFGGAATGADAMNYPFRIGGYNTIRGYDFQQFEGRYAFFANLEYRFNFIEYIRFGFPGRWDGGLIRGSFFVDAGGAYDEVDSVVLWDWKRRETRDMKMSIGVGVQWANFLWPWFPGAVMKIEWASPYNGKKSLPFTKWQGRLSFGFNF